MVNFLSIPPETIYDIGLQLDSKDNRSLRLVSQYVSHSIEALALPRLYIDINATSFGNTRDQLTAITTQPTRIVKHVRTIFIFNSLGKGTPNSSSVDEDASFSRLLPTAMALFAYLKAVSWFTSHEDTKVMVETIIAQIDTKPQLEVSFNCSNGCSSHFPGKLPLIKGKKFLSFTDIFSAGQHAFNVAYAVTKIISQSPGLTHLQIDSGYFAATRAAPSLHEILPKDMDLPPLPIKSLSLRCMRTLLDAETLYHLRSLEHLAIHFNLSTPNQGSHLYQIWEVLRTENIHLKKINVNLTEVDDSLLDYLISYNGIRQIIFDNSARLWSQQREAIANRFFNVVLPQVSQTLQTLHLVTISPGAWCFGSNNAASIAKCKQLEELTVSVVDVIQAHSKGTLALLDQTVAQLPRLQFLEKINVAFVPSIG